MFLNSSLSNEYQTFSFAYKPVVVCSGETFSTLNGTIYIDYSNMSQPCTLDIHVPYGHKIHIKIHVLSSIQVRGRKVVKLAKYSSKLPCHGVVVHLSEGMNVSSWCYSGNISAVANHNTESNHVTLRVTGAYKGGPGQHLLFTYYTEPFNSSQVSKNCKTVVCITFHQKCNKHWKLYVFEGLSGTCLSIEDPKIRNCKFTFTKSIKKTNTTKYEHIEPKLPKSGKNGKIYK